MTHIELVAMRDHMRRVVRAALPCLTDTARTDRRVLHNIAHAVGMHKPEWYVVAHDVIKDMIDRGELVGVK